MNRCYRLDFFKYRWGRGGVQADAGAGSESALEDDVLHLLHIDAGPAQEVENSGKDSDLVLVPYHQHMGGR